MSCKYTVLLPGVGCLRIRLQGTRGKCQCKHEAEALGSGVLSRLEGKVSHLWSCSAASALLTLVCQREPLKHLQLAGRQEKG